MTTKLTSKQIKEMIVNWLSELDFNYYFEDSLIEKTCEDRMKYDIAQLAEEFKCDETREAVLTSAKEFILKPKNWLRDFKSKVASEISEEEDWDNLVFWPDCTGQIFTNAKNFDLKKCWLRRFISSSESLDFYYIDVITNPEDTEVLLWSLGNS